LKTILIGSDDNGAVKYLLELFKGHNVKLIWQYKSQPIAHEKNIHLIVTGAALGDTTDKRLILYAKEKNITSVSIIEHWSWYKKRFELNGETMYPNHIIVNDNYAREKALKDGIPNNKIFVGGNPYLEKLSTSIPPSVGNEYFTKNNIHKDSSIVLFISESIKNSFPYGSNDYLGYDEYSVLDDIINILSPDTTLIIKKHPEEDMLKYKRYEAKQIRIFNEMGMDEMVYVPNIIVGMASMLLLELAMFRDDIISYRPNPRKSFVGEKIGATHYAHDKEKLGEYFLHPPNFKSIPFRKKFNGSKLRILKFMETLV